jgi:hypothetical protein
VHYPLTVEAERCRAPVPVEGSPFPVMKFQSTALYQLAADCAVRMANVLLPR